MSGEVLEKTAREAFALQNADLEVITRKRGEPFKIEDCLPYVEASEKMRATGDQSEVVIRLFKESVRLHYEILSDLARTLRPGDADIVDHFQTPVIVELLYEIDAKFREAVQQLVEANEKTGELILMEAVRRYTGLYGPICHVGFAGVPGSAARFNRLLLDRIKIPRQYEEAILAAKSFGIMTSYEYGTKIIQAIEMGKNITEAMEREKEMFRLMWEEPVDVESELMREYGFRSFDVSRYMAKYKEGIKSLVQSAVEEGVHYSNIIVIPTFSTSDVGTHISPTVFNLAKDDVVMAVMDAISKVAERTVRTALRQGKAKDGWHLLKIATGAFAAATTHILELDGFTPSMVIDLFLKQFHNCVQKHPLNRPSEGHLVDFIDLVARGERILERRPHGSGGRIDGAKVDLTPINENHIIMNPGEKTFYPCAMTTRFAALMRLVDFPCLITSEPVSTAILTNIAAIHKERPVAPRQGCVGCGATRYLRRHSYCSAGQVS